MKNISAAQRPWALLALVGLGVTIVLELVNEIALRSSLVLSGVAGVFLIVGLIGVLMVFRRRGRQ